VLALLDVSRVVYRRPELGEELDDANFRILYLLLFAFPPTNLNAFIIQNLLPRSQVNAGTRNPRGDRCQPATRLEHLRFGCYIWTKRR